MNEPLEIEFKLEFEPGDGAAARLVERFAGQAGVTEHLVSVYFDTPELDLHKAGYSLRVRHIGKRRIQTIKAVGAQAAGLFVRPEWETEIKSDTPLLDSKSGPLLQLVGPDILARIERCFVTDVNRTKYELQVDGAKVELAIDVGQVRTDDKAEPLGEIELELADGSPAILFDLARSLNAETPLRLGIHSKSERGYALATGTSGKSARARRFILDSERDPCAAFASIVHSCIRQFRLNEAVLMQKSSTVLLHQARVALRQLRSAFGLFKPLLVGDGRVDHLRSELHWLAGTMGLVRNLDVLIARADGDLRDQLRAARKLRFLQAREDIDSARTRTLMIDLSEWLAIGDWRMRKESRKHVRQDVRLFAHDVLDRQRKRLKRRGKRLASLDDAHRHAARIEAKKMRYATGFFVSLYPEPKAQRRLRTFREALVELQDVLGDLNDLVIAPQVLADVGIMATFPALPTERREALLRRAEEVHELLIDAKPFWR